MNSKTGVKLLVFTDLDGSLMEHESYSIAPAEPALEELRKRGYTMVLNSSKTAAEMQAIQSRLHLAAPFVCENGAALSFPDSPEKRQVFGEARSAWLPKVHALREESDFHFSGFADWSEKEISELTGLPEAEAALARKREFSEPILWRDSAANKERFATEVNAMGLSLLEGGRFLSIQGQHDKSVAMDWLQQHQGDDKVITVALGDSPNDTAMLDAADIAVIIKSGKSDRIELQQAPKVIRTSRPGPAGWKDAMMDILDSLDSDGLAAFGR